MTQDEIIEIARFAGITIDGFGFQGGFIEEFVAFANLVAAKATEEANARANASWTLMCKKMVAIEREACAQVCDSFYLSWIDIQGRYEFMGEGASECAGAIRARGEQMTQEVLKLALEALTIQSDRVTEIGKQREAITAIKEALREHAMREVQRLGQEIEQEPVVFNTLASLKHKKTVGSIESAMMKTTPPQRTWVGLTKEEVLEFTRASWGVGVTASEFIRAIEVKLKDKNDVAQKTNS